MSAQTFRCNSPFIRHFPWRNGCLLHQGSLSAWVQASAPPGRNDKVYRFICVRDTPNLQPSLTCLQDLAESIDFFETTGIHAHSAQSYVIQFLSNPNLQSHPHGSAHETAFLGQIFLGYQILDTLLWVDGWPPHPSLRVISSTPKPSCTPNRLDTVLKHLETTPSILSRRGTIGFNNSDLNGSTSPSPLRPVLAAALNNMHNAMVCNRKADYQDILSQIYAAAFVMAWFKPVWSYIHS
jgi:hypothetical protein